MRADEGRVKERRGEGMKDKMSRSLIENGKHGEQEDMMNRSDTYTKQERRRAAERLEAGQGRHERRNTLGSEKAEKEKRRGEKERRYTVGEKRKDVRERKHTVGHRSQGVGREGNNMSIDKEIAFHH